MNRTKTHRDTLSDVYKVLGDAGVMNVLSPLKPDELTLAMMIVTGQDATAIRPLLDKLMEKYGG